MIITDVMDQIGNRLDGIDGLRVLPYEADEINPPCALISLPREINYLGTYKRGLDKLVLEVTVLVSLVDDRIRREAIASYADGSGAKSIKEKIEGGTYTAFDVVAVRMAQFTVVSIEDIEYLAVLFTVDVAGPGN